MASHSPDSPSSESSRATSSLGSGRSADSLDFVDRSEVSAMTIADMYAHGKELFDEKKFDAALRVFTAIVAEDCENFEAYQARGQCHMELHNYSKAITDLRRATELHPSASKDHQRAVAHYYAHLYAKLELEDSSPSPLTPVGLDALNLEAWKFYNRALSAYHLSQYEISIADFSLVLKLVPTFAAGYRCRGTAQLHLGRFEKAIEDLLESSRLERCSTTFYNLGLAYGNLNQFESAVKYFTQAIALNPNDSASFSNRGISYKSLAQYENAIADFSTALTLNSESASSYDHRAQCHFEVKSFAASLEDYTRSLQHAAPTAARFSRRAATHFALGTVENAITDIDSAIAMLKSAIKKMAGPSSTFSQSAPLLRQQHHQLAQFYHQRAKFLLESNVAQAEEDLGKSLAHNADSVETLYLRAAARNLLKNAKGAQSDLKRAAQLDGTTQLVSSLVASYLPF